MKKLNNDKKDGITLILLLVVTIVVLLILAGVSINAVVGDDGVIKSAQESAKLTEESDAKKIMNKVVLEYYLARNGETLWYNTPSNKAENCGKGRRSSKLWLNYTCGQKWKNSLVTALNYFK